MTDITEVFTDIHANRGWGHGESVSGSGSDNHQTRHIRRELPILLADLKVERLLDLPCGDMNWMSGVDLANIEYIGGDIVSEILTSNQNLYGSAGRTFMYLDITQSDIPSVDAIFCRDCLVHLPLNLIWKALRNVCRSEAKYFITTTFSYRAFLVNSDCEAGAWRRLNFEADPFNWAPPLRRLIEGCSECGGEFADKSLGVWLIDDLRGWLRNQSAPTIA